MSGQDKKDKVKDLDKEIKDKENILSQLKTEIKSRQKLLEELNKIEKPNQESLISVLQRQEDEILIRDKQIIALNEKIGLLEKGEFARFVADKDKKIEELEVQDEIRNLKNDLDAKDHEIGRQSEDLKEKSKLETDVDSLKKRIKELEVEVALADEKNEKLNEKVTDYKRKKKERDEEYELLQHKYDELRIKYEQLESQYEELKNKSSEPVTTEEHPTPEEENKEKSDQEIIKELREALHQATEEKAEQHNEIQKLKENIKTLYEQIRAYEKEKENNNNNNNNNGGEQAKEPNSREQAYLDTIKEHMQEIQEKQKQIAQLQQDLEERNKKLSELQERVDAFEKDRQNMIGQAELEAKIQEVTAEKDKEITKLQVTLKALEKQNNDKMSLLVEQERKLMDLEDNRTNSKLEELTFSLKDGLAQIQEKIMGTSNQIAELQMQNKQQEIELREVRNEKNNLQKKVKELTGTIHELKDIVSYKDADIIKKDQAAIRMMEEINLLRQKVKASSQKLNKIIEEQVKEHEKKLREKDTEINVLKEMLKSSKTMIRTKENELERLKKVLSPSDSGVVLPKINRRGNESSSDIRSKHNIFQSPPAKGGRVIIRSKADSMLYSKEALNQYYNDEKKALSPTLSDLRAQPSDAISYHMGTKEEGSFFSNKTEHKKMLLPKSDESSEQITARNDYDNHEGEKKKKKHPNNNIFDPNADDIKSDEVKISPVIVHKKKKAAKDKLSEISASPDKTQLSEKASEKPTGKPAEKKADKDKKNKDKTKTEKQKESEKKSKKDEEEEQRDEENEEEEQEEEQEEEVEKEEEEVEEEDKDEKEEEEEAEEPEEEENEADDGNDDD